MRSLASHAMVWGSSTAMHAVMYVSLCGSAGMGLGIPRNTGMPCCMQVDTAAEARPPMWLAILNKCRLFNSTNVTEPEGLLRELINAHVGKAQMQESRNVLQARVTELEQELAQQQQRHSLQVSGFDMLFRHRAGLEAQINELKELLAQAQTSVQGRKWS